MKNLKQLCLFLSAGTIAALSISACGDDTPIPSGTAGTGTAGTGTAGTGTAGTGTAGTGTAGTGTAGTGTAGTATAGTSAGGTGTAGTASGGSGGSGGAAGGSGGSGGSGGKGGAGGSGGGSGGSGGGGGGGGGGPSANCTKWCSGAMGVVTFCAGKGLADAVNTEQKCIAHCTAPEASGNMGLSCWNMHLDNAIAGPVGDHCKHASGAQDQTVCNKTMP
jgi:hypothetical protein